MWMISFDMRDGKHKGRHSFGTLLSFDWKFVVVAVCCFKMMRKFRIWPLRALQDCTTIITQILWWFDLFFFLLENENHLLTFFWSTNYGTRMLKSFRFKSSTLSRITRLRIVLFNFNGSLNSSMINTCRNEWVLFGIFFFTFDEIDIKKVKKKSKPWNHKCCPNGDRRYVWNINGVQKMRANERMFKFF